MFRISFCAVPDFMRVEPVTTSGPTTASIGTSAWREISAPRTQLTAAVNAPILPAYSSPPTTYGVRPLAARPTTVSEPFSPRAFRSLPACSMSSSAPSCERTSACGPPAMMPWTSVGSTP